jgi:NAD(P)H-hydrate epimerase
MKIFDISELQNLYIPSAKSHKGQNGKLLVIGGSHLFHAASLWALTIASRIVDMVFYSSVPENNEVVHELKREFRNGIVVPRDDLDRYANEADVIVIGPGMMRKESSNLPTAQALRGAGKSQNLKNISEMEDEGEQAYYLTKYLLEKYPKKKWVIDAGALQMMEPEWLLPLQGRVVLTPHPGEFDRIGSRIKDQELRKNLKDMRFEEKAYLFAKEYNCIVLLKGHEDVVCSSQASIKVVGGNAGMTKGGTGDVLAGLTGALACNNDLWLAATAASYINKKAGDSLFEKVGYYFNASDLADEIPRVMRELLS